MGTLQISPKLVVDGADRAIDFYRAVLGAQVEQRFTMDDAVVFAQLTIGDTGLQLKDADEHDPAPPEGGGGVILDIQTDDPDAVAAQAVEHGARMIFDVADQPYGARQGRFQDPFGHQWIVGTVVSLDDAEVQSALDRERQ